jgi:hypothetical protein
MNLEGLRADFLRFAHLHSWYKHADLSGETFWAYQYTGQQPRNGVHPQVEDLSGIHWWFIPEPHPGVSTVPFTFGPFLRGREGRDGNVAWGIWIIVKDAGEERFLRWIAENYPQWGSISAEEWEKKELGDPILLELYQSEQDRYYARLLEAIRQPPSSSA